ncbi:hypothetical protein WJX74_008019 [Apatococcus lobatus]|uniref:Uncharacterized protein n=1 Tax=Apatococcus lobatus TaxID=904363 RepID=A0AAW1RFF8_9CHLO
MEGPKEILGYTWSGIEYGEPPSCRFSFFEYCDAIRLGKLELFKAIERESTGWWTTELDRGAGSVLHIAVDHGQLECVKFLVEQRGANVNQQDCRRGWTPLHRCARMAHHRHAPYLHIFQYLLDHGADAELMTFHGFEDLVQGTNGPPLSVLDVAVTKGKGWQLDEVRQILLKQMRGASTICKTPAFVYSGPSIGRDAQAVVEAWALLPKHYPPAQWRPPPAAGFLAAQGMRLATTEPWCTAGGTCVRPLTDAELSRQSRLAAVES